jgi:predicted Zn-dependent protease
MLPDSQGALMGDQAFVNVKQKLPLENDRRANAYVECVAEANEREVGGQREVAVFQQNSLNAFALPDGKIGVDAVMVKIPANQHQLAAVLADDVAHVLEWHTNERVSQEMAMRQGGWLCMI